MNDSLLILGREPALSAAEAVAVAGTAVRPLGRDAVLLTQLADPVALFEQLGGAVKLGQSIGDVASLESLFDRAFLDRVVSRIASRKGKCTFGVSVYGDQPKLIPAMHRLRKTLKTLLHEGGRPVRFVRGEGEHLSSVVVEKQGLLKNGFELLLVATNSETIHAAITTKVQPFEAYSLRDYGRPKRNPHAGMLPPKLARMLLNIAKVQQSTTLLDPFCGSGTILQEAVLLGVRRLVASDSDAGAVEATKRNLRWLLTGRTANLPTVRFLRADARKLGAMLGHRTIDTIVTEPFLGPPAMKSWTAETWEGVCNELELLYVETFEAFSTILRPGGTLLFLLPVYYSPSGPKFLEHLDELLGAGFSLMHPLPHALMSAWQSELTPRKTLLYRRPGQRIGREVLLLRKH